MNTFTFRGEAAEVRWGYHLAATVKDWEFTPLDASSFRVTAHVVSSDTSALSQPALTFCVPRSNGVRWTWPVQSLQITGQALSAALGSQE